MNYDRFDKEVKFYSMVSYLGPLFILARVSRKRCNKLVDFHSWQGGLLFFTVLEIYAIIRIILETLLVAFPIFSEVIGLILCVGLWTLWIVLSVMGIVSAHRLDMQVLPMIGWIDTIFRNHYKYM